MQTHAACSREQKAPSARWDLILGAVQRPAADDLSGLNGSKWAVLHAQFVHSWAQNFYSRANICSATCIKENRSYSYCACVTETNEFASLPTHLWVSLLYVSCSKEALWLTKAVLTFGDVLLQMCLRQTLLLMMSRSDEIISACRSHQWPASSTLVICCVMSAWPKNTQPQRMMGAVVVGCEVGIYPVQSEQFSATFSLLCPEKHRQPRAESFLEMLTVRLPFRTACSTFCVVFVNPPVCVYSSASALVVLLSPCAFSPGTWFFYHG